MHATFHSPIVTTHFEKEIMKKWNLKVKSNPQEISQNLKSALESVDGLMFNLNHDKKNSIKFKMRKRIQYAWYLIYINNVVVDGKLSKTEIENETDVEILFSQHFLWKLVIFTHVFLVLCIVIAIILGKISSASAYLFGAGILAIGILLWITVQKKYERNVQEYKTLISKILKF
ncbi:Conserved hypothetical membrane protein [Zobellia galactanivorans]|uniref:Conserved hypothetical membrane protein n=2 Tax=Zobellia galactanivorans (strain DSM 12802 / CCUG 47099 / CIP 106680 / NCIMB 13871 / Dsij) TaxID=63186 RepID=G0L0I0_ZOBGA|nr:Conserved hypothetical membrane protein [Zobellia galactanivorans]